VYYQLWLDGRNRLVKGKSIPRTAPPYHRRTVAPPQLQQLGENT
jgi:hypothetical protein